MTETTQAEKGLQSEIESAQQELKTLIDRRGQAAMDILGGGYYRWLARCPKASSSVVGQQAGIICLIPPSAGTGGLRGSARLSMV